MEVILYYHVIRGMDTIARREVWNLIERIKRDRVTLLTTHSMSVMSLITFEHF